MEVPLLDSRESSIIAQASEPEATKSRMSVKILLGGAPGHSAFSLPRPPLLQRLTLPIGHSRINFRLRPVPSLSSKRSGRSLNTTFKALMA